MKRKFLYLFPLIMGFAFNSQAQCEKKVTWTSSQTEFLDASGGVQRTEDEKTTLETTSKEIHVTIVRDQTQEINGEVKKIDCQWKNHYKEGKTVLEVELHHSNGESRNATLTIEGKDGKLTVLVQLETGETLRLLVEKYEES